MSNETMHNQEVAQSIEGDAHRSGKVETDMTRIQIVTAEEFQKLLTSNRRIERQPLAGPNVLRDPTNGTVILTNKGKLFPPVREPLTHY